MRTAVLLLTLALLLFTIPAIAAPHVVILVEENHSYESVIGNSSMPYLNGLASKYSLATNYIANAHDSIPNYFLLTAGAALTYNDGTTRTFNVDNIVRHLLLSGLTWKCYAESLPYTGYIGYNTGNYVKRHNPFAYFTDVINSSTERNNIVPLTHLATDIKNNNLPDYSFIVPDMTHDGHDGSLSTVDQWIKAKVAPIFTLPAFQSGGSGLLIITFDESFHTDCRITNVCQISSKPWGGRIATVFAGPAARAATRSSYRYTHLSTLSTVCRTLSLNGCPGAAATTSAITALIR